MLLIITGVGFLIHLYSIGYMHDDKGFGKFFAYLNLFVFFMLLLVMGSNYLYHVHWLGRCGFMLLPAHRFLVHQSKLCRCRQKSIHHEPYWRPWFYH
jgi:predicted MFS family arabinose efflux permease